MEKLLSIIIPTYNMSLYIERCMNSLISSKTIEKLDIIVVNDGSKDDSSEKAKNIAISYPNSIRVIDKENGNYGSCINTGLKLAKGKYIKILDADDLFDTHNLENVLDIIKELDVDMILTDFKMAYSNGKSKLRSFISQRGAKPGFNFYSRLYFQGFHTSLDAFSHVQNKYSSEHQLPSNGRNLLYRPRMDIYSIGICSKHLLYP